MNSPQPDSPQLTNRIRSEYDEVQYPGGAFAASHPDRIRTAALLAGVDSPPQVAACRVLELGCAVGSNLMPMAQTLPNSRFVGIDLSPRQIETGQKNAQQLGLTNIELRCQNLMEFGAAEGQFDYIIAHGLYSWVPATVREQLMEICARHLTPQGVCYISYNTLPGWHLLGAVRDMMLFHSDSANDVASKVARAREILAFVSQPTGGWKAYKDLAAAEQRLMATRLDWYLAHEFLEPVNEAVSFLQFTRQASSHGLHYLCDAVNIVEYSPHFLPPEIQAKLREFAGDDETLRQQYADYLTGRAFRASVLCRADARRQPARPAVAVQQMHLAGRMTEETGQDATSKTSTVSFISVGGDGRMNLRDMGMIAAMGRISGAWPHAVPFAELLDLASIMAPPGDPKRNYAMDLAQMFLLAYRTGVVELRSGPTDFLARNFDHAATTALARRQIAEGELLVNLRHEHIPVTPTIKSVLPLLDGTRDRTQLLDELRRLIDRSELSLPSEAGQVTVTEANTRDPNALLDSVLTEMHIKSLLAAPTTK